MADHLGLFNADWYLAQNPDVAQAVRLGLITAEEHFTSFGKYEGRAAGPLFNVASYLAANPDVADAVAAGHISAYDHFVLYGVNEGRSPVALFDPNFYLTQNPDVAAAVEAGLISATQHFLLYGMNEPRQINPVINLGTYVTSNADLSQAFNEGTLSPLLHLLLYGVNEGRDLGNGVSLSAFANDPDFQNSASNGDGIAALGRVADVAPFLPTFEAPNGWTPSPNTPIPLDFVPPAGVNLVIPPSIVVPPTTVLPPHFDPVDRDPNPQPDPQPSEPDPDVEDPDVEDPNVEDPDVEDPNVEDPDVEDPDVEDPNVEDPDVEDPDVEDPGTGDPGTGDPGTGDPGTGDPGDGDPGTGDPGDGDPGGYEPVYPAGLEVQETESGFVLINTADQSLYITGIEFNGNEINIAGKKGDEGWNLLTYSQISAVMTGEHPLFITPAVVDAMRVAGIKVDGEGMVVVSATDVAGSFDITNIQPTVKLQVHETTADQHIIMRADQATGVSGEGSVTVLSTSEATTIFVNTTGTNLLDPGKGGDSILLHDGGGDDTIRVRTGEMSDDAKIAIQVARDNLASFEDENGDQATLNDKFLTATNIENARDALKLTLDDANQDVSDDELIHGNYAKVQGDFDDAEQALSNHMAKGSIEDLNTHRDTVSGQLDERGLLQTALDNANSELSNHGDRDALESDLSDAQAVQIARDTLRLNQQSAQDALSIHVQDHGEDADLSAAVDSATSAIDARQQLINERTDAEAQLNAHVSNFGEDADLHDSATQARANSSERESLSTAVDVAQDLVDTRDDLQEAVDIANAALTAHVTEKGDETALQDAIDAAELILSERESLKEAVTTASVNLISHMGSYGTDTAIADALANAESDLNTHASTPVKEQSLQDLADAVTAAQTALIADPDNEDLQLALQDAESVHSARQVLEDALSNAQDDLDNHLTATGKTTSELEQAMQDAIAARDANPDEDTEQAVIDATEAYNTRVSLEQAVSEAELDLQTHRESTKIPLTLAELQQEILDLEAALSSDPDNEALQTELQSLTEVRDIRVNLENAWNSALQLFDDREILNTAVQTADSNLSAHMHHGDDDELSDTVAAAHAELVHRGVLLSNQDNAGNGPAP